eukprot:CAMPEP_0184311280 /NCGR_PEP_ID=MMETSP1049-20130417/39991_1 /TAXON_ID=77928 /ORGANISM="Proteomonas sulcata, Strain CCMP704" /LENGTH=43 /DNA_ID= /DNA_START= /DNA_END= /DNA_ORIENTATION=
MQNLSNRAHVVLELLPLAIPVEIANVHTPARSCAATASAAAAA